MIIKSSTGPMIHSHRWFNRILHPTLNVFRWKETPNCLSLTSSNLQIKQKGPPPSDQQYAWMCLRWWFSIYHQLGWCLDSKSKGESTATELWFRTPRTRRSCWCRAWRRASWKKSRTLVLRQWINLPLVRTRPKVDPKKTEAEFLVMFQNSFCLFDDFGDGKEMKRGLRWFKKLYCNLWGASESEIVRVLYWKLEELNEWALLSTMDKFLSATLELVESFGYHSVGPEAFWYISVWPGHVK